MTLVRPAALAIALFALMPSASAEAHDGLPSDIALLDAQLVSRPNDATLRFRRGVLLHRAGKLDRALVDLDVAAAREPSRREVWVERGLVYAERGDAAHAMADLDRFLASGPPSSAALSARAKLHEAAGDRAGARADYEAAIALGGDPEMYLARGRLDEADGEIERAAKGYEEGLRKLGGAVVLRFALIRVLRAGGHYDRAATQIDEAMAGLPVKVDWLLLRGDVHAEAGEAAKARADREAALREIDAAMVKRPTDLRRLARAKALLSLGRAAEAKRELSVLLARPKPLDEAAELWRKAGGGAATGRQ